jgi:hypothetical protein
MLAITRRYRPEAGRINGLFEARSEPRSQPPVGLVAVGGRPPGRADRLTVGVQAVVDGAWLTATVPLAFELSGQSSSSTDGANDLQE